MSANESLFQQAADGWERLPGPILVTPEIVNAAKLCIQEAGKPNVDCGGLLEAAVVIDMHANATEVNLSETDAALQEAKYDDKSQLLRRPYFMRELKEKLDLHDTVGLIYIDLDGFKAVNDTLGHDVGDDVITIVGTTLNNETRSEDVLGATKDDLAGHLAGDEFVVLIDPNNQNITAASGNGRSSRKATQEEAAEIIEGVAARIKNAIGKSLQDDERLEAMNLGVSMGIVVSNPGETAEALLGRADAAMYVDKRAK